MTGFYCLQSAVLICTEILQPTEDRCRDNVEVSEGSKVILARCGDTNKPLTVTSEGPSLNVTLTASDNLFPKRGYVAYYQGEEWGYAECLWRSGSVCGEWGVYVGKGRT